MGHYDIPQNFGWVWVDPATILPADIQGNEYTREENTWVLAWAAAVGIY